MNYFEKLMRKSFQISMNYKVIVEAIISTKFWKSKFVIENVNCIFKECKLLNGVHYKVDD
jgi:hypothetical protein